MRSDGYRREMLAPQRPRGDDRSSGMAIPKSPPDSVQDVLRDPEIQRLLERPEHQGFELPHSRQIYTNRALQMDQIAVVGFDMDYTLAIYHMRRIEQLSFDMTLARLVTELRLPGRAAGCSSTTTSFVMRGLVVDKAHGNLIKMDRFGHVGRAYHGLVAAAGRGVPPAVPERADPPDQRALRVDRHALRAARGVPVRGDHRAARVAGPVGGLRAALRRHPRGDRHGPPRQLAQARGAQGHRPVHLPGSGARAGAAQAALRRARSCSC